MNEKREHPTLYVNKRSSFWYYSLCTAAGRIRRSTKYRVSEYTKSRALSFIEDDLGTKVPVVEKEVPVVPSLPKEFLYKKRSKDGGYRRESFVLPVDAYGDPCFIQHVYFAQEKAGGNIKIGIAINPRARVRSMTTGNSSEVKLIGVILYGGRALEECLHEKFKEYHIKGEWFKAARKILNFLQRHGTEVVLLKE